MKEIAKYAAVFGRAPAVLREPTSNWGVSACMFPALKPSFWRGLVAEAHDMTVYITAGMSDHSMRSNEASRKVYAERVELMALCDVPIAGGLSGTEDVPTTILQIIAEHVLERGILVGIGHTLDFQQPLVTNTAMSGVLFAVPERVDAKRIRRCTRAQELLNLVPITGVELEYVRENGVGALLDKFETAGVRPVFDLFRESAA